VAPRTHPRLSKPPAHAPQAASLDLPRGKTIVTVCASGHRSAAAARMLERSGYQVENLKGGMHGWAEAGLPVEIR